MVNEPDAYSGTVFCNRKLNCKNGDPFQLYFWSTNGGTTTFQLNYMVSIISLPSGEQYVKQEAFDYRRSRLIGDHPKELEGNLQSLGVYRGYDFWEIHNAADDSDLRAILNRHDFTRYR